eukprot:239498_1
MLCVIIQPRSIQITVCQIYCFVVIKHNDWKNGMSFCHSQSRVLNAHSTRNLIESNVIVDRTKRGQLYEIISFNLILINDIHLSTPRNDQSDDLEFLDRKFFNILIKYSR